MATPTVYIVWDPTTNTHVAGPFLVQADATAALRRFRTKSEGKKGDKNESLRSYTVETLNG